MYAGRIRDIGGRHAPSGLYTPHQEKNLVFGGGNILWVQHTTGLHDCMAGVEFLRIDANTATWLANQVAAVRQMAQGRLSGS